MTINKLQRINTKEFARKTVCQSAERVLDCIKVIKYFWTSNSFLIKTTQRLEKSKNIIIQ